MRWNLLTVVAASSALAVAGVVTWRITAPAPIVTSNSSSPTAAGRTAVAPGAADPFSPFQPVPLDMNLDAGKVALGGRLFKEVRLSADATISCASCHDLRHGGADNKAVSVGVGGAEGTINTPTVFNCGFNFRQFWDGRAETLEEQIDGPLLHANEMATRWTDVIATLGKDPVYAEKFAAIYGDGVTAANVRDAISTFERSLVTPDSRFDLYLRGKSEALDAREAAGYRLFTELGCGSCHQGLNMGGNMFQVFGRVGNYFEDRGDVHPSDLGRFNVTGDPRDRFKFKVPSLRNVDLTGPYFHDGSAATLEDAVQVMARYQVGQDLKPEEVQDIVAFLRTLTGKLHR